MDLEFQIEEGQKSYIERIEIQGNIKTKDKVIRRELAVSPGEVFDMVRVKLSKQRLEGSGLLRAGGHPAGADAISAERKEPRRGRGREDHGNVSLGAGFSSVDSLVGIAEYNEGNFPGALVPRRRPEVPVAGDGRHRAAGLRADLHRAVVPGPKLQLSVDLYYRDFAFLSPNDIYTETDAGTKVGLERALGSDFLRGGISYTVEDIGIHLTSGANSDPARQRAECDH